MMKKITLLAMCIAMGIGAMWAQVDVPGKKSMPSRKVLAKGEEVATVDGSTYIIVNGAYAELYDAKDVTGTFTIPASVKNGGKTYPVTGIRGYAFEKTNATTVNTGDALVKIWKSAFTSSQLQVVNLGAGVTNIEAPAFNTQSLTAVNVASGNNNFASQDGVLYNKAKTTLLAYPASKSTGSVSLASTVQIIERKSFSGAIMSTLTLPSSVTLIKESAFEYCNNLKTADLGSNLKELEGMVFYQCPSLQKVTLPATFEKMGTSVFAGCSSLQSIDVSASNKWYTTVDGVMYSKDKKTICICPAGKTGDFVIPDGTETVGTAAFNGCKLLKNIQIPNSVTRIEALAFASCWFESITIPNSVTVLAPRTFMYSNSLRDIKLSENITEIGVSTFEGCFSLSSITIPDKVTTIGGYAFSGCSALRTVTFGTSITDYLETSAFNRCNNVKTVYVRSKNPVQFISTYFPNTHNIGLYVPRGCAAAYKKVSGWSWFDSITEYDPEYAGDVNADSDVNVTDVTSLINHILGNASFEAKRCDVNEDSKVDVSDVTSLINLLLY